MFFFFFFKFEKRLKMKTNISSIVKNLKKIMNFLNNIEINKKERERD